MPIKGLVCVDKIMKKLGLDGTPPKNFAIVLRLQFLSDRFETYRSW